MKTWPRAALLASVLLVVQAFAAQKIEVAFSHPEKFTDIKTDYPDDGSHRTELLKLLEAEFTRSVSGFVKDGYRLALTFTEIDLAGDFRDGLHQGATRVRLVNEFYAPRLAFDFTLTDAAGKVVAQGHRDLTDHSFLHTQSPADRDAFKYEKAILRQWARRELKS